MTAAATAAMRIHVWERCFLLQAGSLHLGPRPRLHKRLSATILVANRRPFTVAIAGQPPRPYQGLIIAPNVARSFLDATDADLTVLDAGLSSARYRALQGCLQPGAARALDAAELARLQALLAPAFAADLDCGGAAALFDAAIAALGGVPAPAPAADPRLARVLQWIEQQPLDELSLPRLAELAGVSESRLRVLFQRQLGCGPAQYMRWVAAWKAIALWTPGKTFTDVAHAIGFHDLAHISHALGELFGLSPSALTTAQGVRVHRCGD